MSSLFFRSRMRSGITLSTLLVTVSLLWMIFFRWTAKAQNQGVLQLSQVQGVNPPSLYVTDEFILVLKHASRENIQLGVEPSGAPAVNLPSLQALLRRHNVSRLERQFPGAPTRPLGSTLPDLSGHYKVRVPLGGNLDAAMAEFRSDPNVESTERIGVHPIYKDPNDYFYSANPPVQWHLWGLHGIDANLAWDQQTGQPNVVVAILDSGVRYTHPDLDGNVWTNSGEIPNNGLDDDNNGKVDDVVGYDFVASTSGNPLYSCCDSDCSGADNNPSDHNGHGTHVAGTVSAVTNNARGVAGIAGGYSSGASGNGVKIMPLRIGWNADPVIGGSCGTGLVRMDYAAEAMYYVATQKARGVNIAAVNCSWGSSNSGGLAAAVDNLLANDVMIVHAAGNSNSSSADYLGTRTDVMNVAATDINGNGASFTNYGSWVDLAAPGVDIVSTYHLYTDPSGEYYAISSGTSMATPHACGVAALLESANPSLTGPQKFNLMVSNIKPYTDTRYLGSGILSAKMALDAAGGGGTNTPPTATSLSQNPVEDTSLTITLGGSDSEQCELTFSIVASPSKGTLGTISSPACTAGAPSADSAMVVYTPNPNANGSDSFTYKVNDGQSDSNIATVSISIAPVNDTPSAQNKSVTTTKGTAINIQLTGTDVETCNLIFANSGLASASGSLSSITDAACTTGTPNNDSATLTYTPNSSFVGNDSFTYTVNDGVASSNQATVSITVNDPATSTSHVGDLDGTRTSVNPNNWKASVTITIHLSNVNHTAVAGATVSGNWSAGSASNGSCTTGTSGTCTVTSSNLSKKNVNSVTFAVSGVGHTSYSYSAAANHDPDGDSNGTAITINKP